MADNGDGRMMFRTVTITHPELDGELTMELPASSDDRAVRVARGYAVHMYRAPQLFDASGVVIERCELDACPHRDPR